MVDLGGQLSATISRIVPLDTVETSHIQSARAWIESGAELVRGASAASRAQHLVAYFLVVDPSDLTCLLVLHRRSGLWLPTGGHVEAGEDLIETVRREASEELGLMPDFSVWGPEPLFLTVTETIGQHSHTDVSLWYALAGRPGIGLHPDPAEFSTHRWWSRAELASADPAAREPDLDRFLTKLASVHRRNSF